MPTPGKQYRGDVSPAITTTEQVLADMEAQAPYAAKDGAVELDIYFAQRGILDPVMRASMRAWTKIRKATLVDFDVLFTGH